MLVQGFVLFLWQRTAEEHVRFVPALWGGVISFWRNNRKDGGVSKVQFANEFVKPHDIGQFTNMIGKSTRITNLKSVLVIPDLEPIS
jgi:hypothetical protein